MLSLHSFVASYFRDQLRGEEGGQIRNHLVKEIGQYTYEKTLALHQELQAKSRAKAIDDEAAIEFTGEIFRYALTASKFLRMGGNDYLAKNLPIDIKASIREMVLYFYQQVRDYEKALEYSDKWLKMKPDDPEIKLYKARCLRNLGEGNNLVEAERILTEIESVTHSKFFKERISNEKGKIAIQRGEENSAMLVYEQAIEDGATLPDIYIGVARLYLRRAREHPDNSFLRQQFAKKAVDLLEKGRVAAESGAVAIDVYYLDMYIDALVEIEDDEAYPMLEQALAEMPTDARLNYRMAEIHRKNLNLRDSIKHAQCAIRYGSIAAHLTLANVYLSQAFTQREEANRVESGKLLNLALKHAKIYRDRSPFSKHVVAATLMSTIYRTKGDWESAKEIIKPFEETGDRYLRCEQYEILLHEAAQIFKEGKHKEAFDIVKNVRALLNSAPVDIHYQDLITRTANLYDEYEQYL